jgi:hypothetical protein
MAPEARPVRYMRVSVLGAGERALFIILGVNDPPVVERAWAFQRSVNSRK